MQSAIIQFRNNLTKIRQLEALYHHLITEIQLSSDLSDLLRAQLVYAISAFDKLIHELVRLGMLEAFNGQRLKTAKFNNFTISLATLNKIQNAAIRAENEPIVERADYFFEQEVISKHKHLSFQEPDKVADALSSIWEESQKWQKIAIKYSASERDLKLRLKKIVSRRNQIVHEADIDLQTHERNDIDETEVKAAIDFIEKLGESIFHCINQSN